MISNKNDYKTLLILIIPKIKMNDLFPIRCYSCGKILAKHQIEYQKRISYGETPEKIMDDLGIKRYCCRGNVLSPSRFSTYKEIFPENHIVFRNEEDENNKQTYVYH
uniref:RNA polymerases N/ 8 kDa subunit n=1 Tax=Pithovirus LCPAC104 TaxID=2506589 RepID=A0A481Z584_9VIRU|nr:MAG: RNA polymerases N/ 8 kDa subunit [Pithovirus LCPAC104]